MKFRIFEVQTSFIDNLMSCVFEFIVVMKHLSGDAQQGIRNINLELERGDQGRAVHMRITFLKVPFEEIGLLIINCGLE